MDVIEFGCLTAAQRHELEGDEPNPFGVLEPPLEWRPKPRHVALRDADGRLAASVGLLCAEVKAAEAAPFEVVGIGGVIVAPGRRGKGHARTVIEAALRRAETIGPTVALLFCFPDKVGLYARFGFSEVRAPLSVQQPGGVVPMPQPAMWRPLRPGATWPPGEVRLLGLPF